MHAHDDSRRDWLNDGDYLVEVFGPKRRVAVFQKRTLSEAKEAAWQEFDSRNGSTARVTTQVLVSRIERRDGPPCNTWTRQGTAGQILPELRWRWDKKFQR
jgi:hypothetical protein